MHQSQTMEVMRVQHCLGHSYLPLFCFLLFPPLSTILSVFVLKTSMLFIQGCSSPIVVKFADTQKDKEQKRMTQQLQQQMQQLNAASMWGNLTGLNSLGPQYLAVSTAQHCLHSLVERLLNTSVSM